MIKLSTLIHLPSTLAWSLAFEFWLCLHFNTCTDSLLAELLKDPYNFSWSLLFEAKLHSIGLTLESFSNSDYSRALSSLRKRLWGGGWNPVTLNLNTVFSPCYFGLPPFPSYGSNYFHKLVNPCKRQAFVLARFNILSSSVLSWRYQNIPLKRRTCKFCCLEPYMVTHILCHYAGHSKIHDCLLEPTYLTLLVLLKEMWASSLRIVPGQSQIW